MARSVVEVLFTTLSGMSNGARLKAVGIGVSSRLQPSVVEVILVDELMSLVAVYAPIEVCVFVWG